MIFLFTNSFTNTGEVRPTDQGVHVAGRRPRSGEEGHLQGEQPPSVAADEGGREVYHHRGPVLGGHPEAGGPPRTGDGHHHVHEVRNEVSIFPFLPFVSFLSLSFLKF